MKPQTRKQIGFALFTFIVYTLFVNWKIAILLMVGVGFHEYSHLWAARRVNIPTKGFYLVPFMGGVAIIDGKYQSYWHRVFVVLAGPIGGGLLALATLGLYLITGIPFLAAAASWMCLLNVFNLLPLSFMDGGQLMDSITYSLNRTLGVMCHIGSTLIAIFVLWKLNPVLSILAGFFGGSSALHEFLNWKNFRQGKTWLCSESFLHPPTKLTKGQMVLTALGWLTTAIVLLAAMTYLSKFPEANLSSLIKKG